jgi:hypothetical protein
MQSAATNVSLACVLEVAPVQYRDAAETAQWYNERSGLL